MLRCHDILGVMARERLVLLVRSDQRHVEIRRWEQTISSEDRRRCTWHDHTSRRVRIDIDKSVVVMRQIMAWIRWQFDLLTNIVVTSASFEKEAACFDWLSSLRTELLPFHLFLLGILQDFAIVEPCTLIASLSQCFA